MKPHRSACTRQRAWVSRSHCLFFPVFLGLPSCQAGPYSGMSGLEAAKARFLSPASGATRTDSYHIRIEIGSGEPASFQVPIGPPTVHLPGMGLGIMQNNSTLAWTAYTVTQLKANKNAACRQQFSG